jgi:hypothetical protein
MFVEVSNYVVVHFSVNCKHSVESFSICLLLALLSHTWYGDNVTASEFMCG